MTPTWHGEDEPPPFKPNAADWVRIVPRAALLIVLITVCLVLLLLIRVIERPLFGLGRPITPYITQFVCRNAFRILGIGFSTTGSLMKHRGAVVANHTSWLDIFALNARKRIYFVSKAEVANWPGIGWLARATGTLFIDRDRRKAKTHNDEVEARLKAGHKLLFFPEGTSSDGLRVLPFKTTLFQSFFSDHLRDAMYVQPVSVMYHAPDGQPRRFYGWWGDMEFGDQLLKTLAAPRQGRVELIYHTALKVSDFDNRKALAAQCEAIVRAGHTALL